MVTYIVKLKQNKDAELCVFTILLFVSIIYTTYTEKIWKDRYQNINNVYLRHWDYRILLSSFIAFCIFLFYHDYMILL